MKVVFKDGREVFFDADTWHFDDTNNNNVYMAKGKNVIAHINWAEVLYITKEGERNE